MLSANRFPSPRSNSREPLLRAFVALDATRIEVDPLALALDAADFIAVVVGRAVRTSQGATPARCSRAGAISAEAMITALADAGAIIAPDRIFWALLSYRHFRLTLGRALL
mgnify:CR=1 FL=1